MSNVVCGHTDTMADTVKMSKYTLNILIGNGQIVTCLKYVCVILTQVFMFRVCNCHIKYMYYIAAFMILNTISCYCFPRFI